jgi:hypothetical protein
MSVIDKILWLLRDGEWHDLKEITKNIELSEFKVEIAVNFLGEYDFIQQNEKTRKIKLQPSILKFVRKIHYVEREETLTH